MPKKLSQSQLKKVIEDTLSQHSLLTARQIADAFAKAGVAIARSDVNGTLYRWEGRVFLKDKSLRPRWSLKNASRSAEIPAAPASPTEAPPELPQLPLYRWQREALSAWESANRRGIIEAVTGTGKTRVGIAAIQNTLAAGDVAHILVPTIALQAQWRDELRERFPSVRVGLRGDGKADTFRSSRLIVSVVNSARDFDVGALSQHALLVADECHRYGADENAKALNLAFRRRLGLTATYARDDDGCNKHLAPYFGDTCFQMGYAQAVRENVTAHFKVALVGVDFATQSERHRYDATAEQSSKARGWLVANRWAPEEPFGDYMKYVSKLADEDPIESGEGSDFIAVKKARDYLKAFSERKKLLADTSSKLDVLSTLSAAIRHASRTIVFTESIQAATDAAAVLAVQGIRAKAMHSKMDMPQRRDVLAAFSRGNLQVITAPKILDEGIDVPEADLGIILAASKSRRQMVQRMGRVLRRKQDGRLARFVIIFVRDTNEDPEMGTHESFLEEITDPAVADDVRVFESWKPGEDVVSYVNDFYC